MVRGSARRRISAQSPGRPGRSPFPSNRGSYGCHTWSNEWRWRRIRRRRHGFDTSPLCHVGHSEVSRNLVGAHGGGSALPGSGARKVMTPYLGTLRYVVLPGLGLGLVVHPQQVGVRPWAGGRGGSVWLNRVHYVTASPAPGRTWK